ncbi:MAG: chemotaxis protein MotB [Calditrichaeota bacterium]|nr:MAG: chemotaxis protein MotB [Calditrichota bacterium]
MTSTSTYLFILLVLLAGFAGYYYLDKVVPMQTNMEELSLKNQELTFQIEDLQEKNKALSRELDRKVKEVSSEKDEEIKQLKATYGELITDLKKEVQKGEVTITRLADQLNVNIVDRIIFPSGKAELSPEGIKVLRRVGKIIKNAKGKIIKVEGHTDNVPIHPKLQSQFPTNWELSVARATNVVRFLQDEVGIDPRKLEAAGFGPYRPIASNRTARGRARNRRIEIVLLPKHKRIQKRPAVRAN